MDPGNSLEQFKSRCEERIATLESTIRQAERDVSRLTEEIHFFPKKSPLLRESRKNLTQLYQELSDEQARLDYYTRELKITDPKTLQSATLVRMASHPPVETESVKDARTTVHPLQRLRAHGPHFYAQWAKNMDAFAGVPGALERSGVTLKGGKRKRKTKRRFFRKQ